AMVARAIDVPSLDSKGQPHFVVVDAMDDDADGLALATFLFGHSAGHGHHTSEDIAVATGEYVGEIGARARARGDDLGAVDAVALLDVGKHSLEEAHVVLALFRMFPPRAPERLHVDDDRAGLDLRADPNAVLLPAVLVGAVAPVEGEHQRHRSVFGV